MAGCSVFNEEYQMVLAQFYGHVNIDDLEKQAVSILKNSELSSATRQLINFSQVEGFDPNVDMERLSKVIEINKKQHDQYPDINVAIVAPDALSFNLAMVYKEHFEAHPGEGKMKICMDVDEAIEWLGGDKTHWKIMVERVSEMCKL